MPMEAIPTQKEFVAMAIASPMTTATAIAASVMTKNSSGCR